ncbi:MAG: ABC transporter permease [Neisseriaceae bacterium]
MWFFYQVWKASVKQTFRLIARDNAVLLLLVIAPTIYCFFYGWPMQKQQVLEVPTGIVDLDHSKLSRMMIRYASASPRIRPKVFFSETSAQQAMVKRSIEGYLVIPPYLTHDLSLNRPVKLRVYTNGSYALLNQAVSYGFLESMGTISAGIDLKKLTARGLSMRQARVARNPLALKLQGYFNTFGGYGRYILPAVAIVIFQQTLLMAVAMFIATLWETGKAYTSTAAWLGRITVFTAISWLLGLFYFGWVFYFLDVARAGNILGACLLLFIFSPTVVILGSLTGLLVKGRERCLYVVIFISLPLYFICGISWPSEGMPAIIKLFRYFVPSTAAVNASLRLNQMGATLYDVRYLLLDIFLIGLVALSGLMYVGRHNSSQEKRENAA